MIFARFNRFQSGVSSESGAVAPIVALLLLVLLGFVALGSDIGYLYVERTQLQQAADAAALAGAQDIGTGSPATKALKYASLNGIDTASEITANQSASAYASGDAWRVSLQRQARILFGRAMGLGPTSPVAATATAVKSPAKTAKIMPYGLWAGNASGPYTLSGSLNPANSLEYRGNGWISDVVQDNPNPCGGHNQPTCHWDVSNGTAQNFKGFLDLQGKNQPLQIFMTSGTKITAISKGGNNSGDEQDPMAEICSYVTSTPPKPALFPLLDNASDAGNGGYITFDVIGFRALYLDPISGCGGPNGMGKAWTGHPSSDQSFVVTGLGGGSTPTNVYVLQLWH